MPYGDDERARAIRRAHAADPARRGGAADSARRGAASAARHDRRPAPSRHAVGVQPRPPRPGDVAATQHAAAAFAAERRPAPPRHAMRAFVYRYGWRAYALPLLLVLSVVALLTTHDSPARTRQQADGGAGAQLHRPAPPVASGDTALKSDTPGAGANDTALKAAALPAGPAYTVKGDGTFTVLKGSSSPVGASGKLYRYSIEVEKGITGVDVQQFADLVQQTLSDPRSWSGHGVRVQRVDSGQIDFHVSLTSVMTVRKLCGYEIPIETSCYVRAGNTSPVNRVTLDVARWVRGAAGYVGDLNAYRIYLINHEDGHAMGHEHAHECLPNGYAPVMMQQTIGLKDPHTGKICEANPWPYPPGVAGAPGAEQPDTPQNSEFQINGD